MAEEEENRLAEQQKRLGKSGLEEKDSALKKAVETNEVVSDDHNNYHFN